MSSLYGRDGAVGGAFDHSCPGIGMSDQKLRRHGTIRQSSGMDVIASAMFIQKANIRKNIVFLTTGTSFSTTLQQKGQK